MAKITKYNPLDSHSLSIVNIGGLVQETIIAGKAAGVAALGSLGTNALNVLVDANSDFRANLITVKANPLTEQITQFDKQRDDNYLEIWRTVKTTAKSSFPDKAEAGKLLMDFLKPYHNLAKEPLMSETSTLNYLQTQFNANPAFLAAATTLQLTDLFVNLFATNERVSILWNERALSEAEKSGPSPSSLKQNLEKAYNGFCNVVLQTLKLQPTPEIETLFSVMNEIRIKYAKFLPIKLTNANTVVEPVAIQKYTGKPITPVSKVFIKKENEEFNELLFTVDFYITYRNNVEVGEAQIIIHGKGKYSGRYTSTFHIKREN
jgi:hypothetical protein